MTTSIVLDTQAWVVSFVINCCHLVLGLKARGMTLMMSGICWKVQSCLRVLNNCTARKVASDAVNQEDLRWQFQGKITSR